MGIQNYLKRISTATKDIKSAIEEKGVPVSQCDGFEQLADKVRAIQTGSGNSLFVMLAFKQSETTPAVPTGGYFSDENITYPTGWSDGAGLTENIWMSYAIIDGNGNFYKNWVSPIKISSGSTSSSIDLTNYATKAWVTEQISKLTGDDIDLSNYYTKSEVDAKIQSAGVSSINDLTGDVTLKGSSSVNISKSGNILTFTATGGSTSGDSYISCYLYKTSSSKDTAPEIPSADTTWDSETKSLINTPAEWSTKVTVTSAAPYVWQIVGTFNTTSGEQIGDWTGPNCISGEKGDPGTNGNDGTQYEFVYALIDQVYEEDQVSIDNESANAAGAKTMDNYRPYFVFDKTTVLANDAPRSVTETNPYQWRSQRVKKLGAMEWSEFEAPKLYNNYTKAELDDDTKNQIIADAKKTATEIANTAVKEATSTISKARADIEEMQTALGKVTEGETKKYKKLETLDGLVSAVGDVTNLGGDELTGDTIISNLSTIKQDSKSIGLRVTNQEQNYEKLDTKVGEIEATANSVKLSVTELENALKTGDGTLLTAGQIITKDNISQYVVDTNFDDLTEGYNQLSSKVNNLGNASGKYLISSVLDPSTNEKVDAYVTEEGHYIYATDEVIDSKEKNYGSVFYYAPDKVWVPYKDAEGATQTNYYEISTDESEGTKNVTVDISTKPGHLIGSLKTNYTTSGTDPDTNEKITDEKKETNSKLNENNATRNAVEIAQYGKLTIDSFSNIQTKLENGSAEVTLSAMAENGELAALLLKSNSDGTTLINLLANEVNASGVLTAKELIADGELNGTHYTVNVGPTQDTSKSTIQYFVPEDGSSNTSRQKRELTVKRDYQFVVPESGYTLNIPIIRFYDKLHVVTTGTTENPKASYKITNAKSGNVVYTSDEIRLSTDGTNKKQTLHGSAGGEDYVCEGSIAAKPLENIEAGTYIFTCTITMYLLGANMLHASHYWYSFKRATLVLTKDSKGTNGVFLAGNGLKIKSSADASDEVISEISITNEGAGKGITSAGVVLSPSVNRIQVVEKMTGSNSDPNTIYIVLA